MTSFLKYHLFSFVLMLSVTFGLYEFVKTKDIYFFILSVVSACGLIMVDEKIKRTDHV
jgi:hypothetical protein